jgi:ubiquitin
MDKRLNRQIESYISKFKNDVKLKVIQMSLPDIEQANELVSYIFSYDRLVLSKEDVSKRKRVKNSIPDTNRCRAKRATGEQCTRKQKEGCIFCGTHVKGTPHGVIQTEQQDTDKIRVEVFAQEIYGITYYLDTHKNVYNTEDILNNKTNPGIIAKYELVDNVYSIPALGLS